MVLPFSSKPHPCTQAPQRAECHEVFHACCSWVQGASREMFWLALHGALSHKTSGLNSVWRMYTAILRHFGWEERSYFLDPVLVAVSWCCLGIKKNTFTSKGRSLNWSLGMVKKMPFLKRVRNNFFLSMNCLPCLCLGPINYTKEHKMWSSIAQNWHYCWKDQAYRPEGVITLSWGYSAILSWKPSLITSSHCLFPFSDSILPIFYHW